MEANVPGRLVPPTRNYDRYLLAAVVLAVIVACAGYSFLKYGTIEASSEMRETARAFAEYLVCSGGAWPDSLDDLERAAIVRRTSPDAFTVVVREHWTHLARPGFVVEIEDLEIGWGGVPVDSSGVLIAPKGIFRHVLNEAAESLSRRLRELAEELAAHGDEGHTDP